LKKPNVQDLPHNFSVKNIVAFVSVPKDLSRIKSKLALNMSKRQLICFGIAVSIGIPTYIFTRETIGNSPAVLLMMGLMLPFFFLAMYERDGQPAETVLRNYIRTKIYWPGIRPFKTENFYEIMEREGEINATRSHGRAGREASDQPENKEATKTPVGKHPGSEEKQGRSAKRR
jgi:hypothetical protein